MNYTIPSVYSQKAISGNPRKIDTGVMLVGGDANPLINGTTLLDGQNFIQKYGYNVGIAVEVGSSGNFGAIKAISGSARNTFNTEGRYIGMRFNGSINNVLLGGAADAGIYRYNKGWTGYQRYGISSINAFTGAVSYSANRGVAVAASGSLDGAASLGVRADHANALNSTDLIPGELVTFTGALNAPSQLNYDDRTHVG